MNSSDEHLRFAGAGLSQEHAVLTPGRMELGSRVGRLVQEGLALRQAVDDVLVDCSAGMTGGKGAPPTWRQLMRASTIRRWQRL